MSRIPPVPTDEFQRKQFDDWLEAKYPYDMAECSRCATYHSTGCETHPEMTEEGKRLGFHDYIQRQITPEVYERILSFRKKFARFYPKRAR